MNKREASDKAIKMLEKHLTDSLIPKLCHSIEDQTIAQTIFDKPGLRALVPQEIELLEKHGNTAFDWKRVHVTDDFTPKNIWNTRFHRQVIIGSLNGSTIICGTEFSSGISNAFLSDAIIGDGAFIHNVALCSKVVIGKGAVIHNCGSVTNENTGSFCIGTEISAGNEAGDRMFPLLPELNFEQAVLLARAFTDKAAADALRGKIRAFAEKTIFKRSIIGDNARLCNTTRACSFFLGSHACIQGALEISDSVILSNKEEPVHIGAGSIIRNSVLQYGSHVDTQAIVDHSFLAEYSGASRHGKITESFIGPNTHVAEGEVTASFVGPFVGFHHQALLIAAWWPEGRGNIAYGANIGSNHTGKLADQEIFPGEGTFFGLSSSVKFPANLREAPCSIIATSVTMLAQKLLFPFSLVNSPSRTIKGIPPAFNEIFPGWIISENIYSLLRNSDKYVKRNKARRVSFDFSPWRPDLVLLAHKAKTLLESASGKEFYTDKEIPGLGKNFLTEENRIAGITAYSFYCDYFCRETLFALLKDNPKAFAELGKSSGKTGTIPHEIAVQIFAHNEEIADSTLLLQNLKHQKKEIQRMLLSSKSRDDKRGEKIIDDYTSVHLKTEDDSFIKDYSARLEKEIAALS